MVPSLNLTLNPHQQQPIFRHASSDPQNSRNTNIELDLGILTSPIFPSQCTEDAKEDLLLTAHPVRGGDFLPVILVNPAATPHDFIYSIGF